MTDYQAEAGLDVRNTLDLPQLGMMREVRASFPRRTTMFTRPSS